MPAAAFSLLFKSSFSSFSVSALISFTSHSFSFWSFLRSSNSVLYFSGTSFCTLTAGFPALLPLLLHWRDGSQDRQQCPPDRSPPGEARPLRFSVDRSCCRPAAGDKGSLICLQWKHLFSL